MDLKGLFSKNGFSKKSAYNRNKPWRMEGLTWRRMEKPKEDKSCPHFMSTFQNQLMAVQKIEGNVVVGPYVTWHSVKRVRA